MADQKFCVLINSMTEGGAEKAVATLIPEYQRQGANVSVLCLERNDVHKIETAKIEYLSNQTGANEGAIRKFVSLFVFARKLKKYIQANGIRMVQSHIYRANYVNVLARLMGSVHKIQVVNHGIPEQYNKGGIAGRINQKLIRWLYPRADQVICPSLDMMNSLQQMGVAANKLVHIPNPVDLAEIEQQGAKPVDNPFFEFDPAKKYVITIGRLEPVKRIGDIIVAFARLATSRPDIELVILGSGSQQQQLESSVESLGLSQRVHLLGHVDNPYQYLARSEMFISASENEGFSLVIVEALALGVPVISSDCPGGPCEILAPGITLAGKLNIAEVKQMANGIFVRTRDVAGLAQAMTLLLDDAPLSAHYASQGKIRARHFDKAEAASRYLQNIYQLMASC